MEGGALATRHSRVESGSMPAWRKRLEAYNGLTVALRAAELNAKIQTLWSIHDRANARVSKA
jgi:hypothetical protein